MMNNKNNVTGELSVLRKRIETSFSLDELKTICFDLEIIYDNISGNTIEAKSRELVIFFARQDKINQLADRCQSLRPEINWPCITPTKILEKKWVKDKTGIQIYCKSKGQLYKSLVKVDCIINDQTWTLKWDDSVFIPLEPDIQHKVFVKTDYQGGETLAEAIISVKNEEITNLLYKLPILASFKGKLIPN